MLMYVLSLNMHVNTVLNSIRFSTIGMRLSNLNPNAVSSSIENSNLSGPTYRGKLSPYFDGFS